MVKIRQGFVSNSSSSSFICDVSGEEKSGRDCNLSDCNMYECINGHIFLEGYLVGDINYQGLRKKLIKEREKYLTECTEENYPKYIDRLENWKKSYIKEIEELKVCSDEDVSDYSDEDSNSNIPAKNCPICQYKHLKESDGFSFLLKKYGITKQEILQEMENQQYYSKEGK